MTLLMTLQPSLALVLFWILAKKGIEAMFIKFKPNNTELIKKFKSYFRGGLSMARQSTDERRQKYLEKKKVHETKRFQPQKKSKSKPLKSPTQNIISTTPVQNKQVNLKSKDTTNFFSSTLVPWLMREDVEAMDTETIIHKLRKLGVPFKLEPFKDLVKHSFTIEDVVTTWEKLYTINQEGQNDDFIFLAAWVLWDRIVPGMPNIEHIEDLIDKAYDMGIVPRCDQWLVAWKMLKDRCSPSLKVIQNVEPGGWIVFEEWCIDVINDLWDAASEGTPRYFKRRLQFCTEFLARFPESQENVLDAINLGLAESLFATNKANEGEFAFQALTMKNPGNARLYMRWGDMYWYDILPGKLHASMERARELYQIAERMDPKRILKQDLEERLEDLNEEKSSVETHEYQEKQDMEDLEASFEENAEE